MKLIVSHSDAKIALRDVGGKIVLMEPCFSMSDTLYRQRSKLNSLKRFLSFRRHQISQFQAHPSSLSLSFPVKWLAATTEPLQVRFVGK
jgi:hypothetical protein